MTAAGFVVFALAFAALLLNFDSTIRQKGAVLGPVEHWPVVKIHGSGSREHTLEYNGTRNFEYFCVDGPDPFYEGMTVDLYFQRYEKCWQIVNYNILRRDDYGNPAETN